MPLVLQYNKRDLPNALPVSEMDKEINKLQSPTFESVATTGLGVEETLKGITQLVLTHLVKKYGLEGSGPIEKEIHILNAPTQSSAPAESLWDEDEDPFGPIAPAPAAKKPAAKASPAPPPARSAPPVPTSRSIPVATAAPVGEAEFEFDDDADESIPLVATELVGTAPAMTTPANPFDDDYFNSFSGTDMISSTSSQVPDRETEVPTHSIEIPLPPGILDSLPVLGEAPPAKTVASAPERRSTDGLVREVTIPLNLSIEEIRNHRRLRIKITLDVNLLP
jgi:hypothetical protein